MSFLAMCATNFDAGAQDSLVIGEDLGQVYFIAQRLQERHFELPEGGMGDEPESALGPVHFPTMTL
jgi:hypothetical protein